MITAEETAIPLSHGRLSMRNLFFNLLQRGCRALMSFPEWWWVGQSVGPCCWPKHVNRKTSYHGYKGNMADLTAKQSQQQEEAVEVFILKSVKSHVGDFQSNYSHQLKLTRERHI